jgi:methylmalonyl-CoA mutase
MKKSLFAEFNAVSSKQWKQKIQYELNGADYNQSVIWESLEGIKVKPFYHRDETQKILKINTSKKAISCQNVYVFDIEKTIAKVVQAIENNADSFIFTIENKTIDLCKVLEKIPPKIDVYFNFNFFDKAYLKKIDALAQQKNCIYYCNIDPIGHLSKNGNWINTEEKDNFDALNNTINETSNLALLSVNGDLYQNVGANCVQQIAFTLAHCVEYFSRISNIKHPILIPISVGSDYFFEIAKLRALRYLFDIIIKEFGFNQTCKLIVFPTKRNKTIYHASENELKIQAECESAILGGADVIYTFPSDFLYKKTNYKSTIKAQKQLEMVVQNCDSSQINGSYFVENLTLEIAEKALKMFKKIEQDGGFLTLLKEEKIQQKIKESAEKEQKNFDATYKIDSIEKIKNEIELYPFLKINPRKIIVPPLLPKRLAESHEKKQLELE